MHFRWLHYVGVVSVCAAWWLSISTVSATLTDLEGKEWETHLSTRPPPDTLVLLYADNCLKSSQAEQLIESLVKNGEISQILPGVRVMRQKEGGPLSKSLNIRTYPALVLVRDDATAFYTGEMEDPDEVLFWLQKAGLKAVTKLLNDDTFEHLTQASTGSTTGHWAVIFHSSNCLDHFPLLESIGVSEKMWMNVARVNTDQSPKLARRFKIKECLELIYFREGKMYRYETRKYDVLSVTSFLTSWFRNVKATPVPLQPTAFDELTESIALYIKNQLEGENRTFTLAVIAGFTVTVVLVSIFCCLTGGSDSKKKTE